MGQSGRKSIKIDAPIMITTNKIAVWMDEGRWARNFFAWLKENNYSIVIKKWDTKNWGEIPADFGRK